MLKGMILLDRRKNMNIAKIVLLLAAGSSLAFAGLFTVKSAKVEYKTTRSGTIGEGASELKIDEKGTLRMVFDAYGNKQLNERKNSETTLFKLIKQKQTRKTHTLSLIDGTTIFDVDFKTKKINKRSRDAAPIDSMSYDELMKHVGAKKIGTDTVLGFECIVWQLDKMKICVYKGIPLRTEDDNDGIKTLEIATKIEFNSEITESDFTLPDYPIVEGKDKK